MMMRLSAVACGALVAGAIGLAAPSADAAVVAYSHAGLSYTLNNGPSNPAGVVAVNPNPAWVANGTAQGNSNAVWVAPEVDDGFDGPVNGTEMTITHLFTLQHSAHLTGEIYADDSAQVTLVKVGDPSGVTFFDFNPNPDGSPCGGGPIGCTAGNGGFINYTLSADLAASGQYLFTIITRQVAGTGFGTQYSVTVTPIPGAVFLFGPAMAGLGYLGLRRKKTGTNDDVTGAATAA